MRPRRGNVEALLAGPDWRDRLPDLDAMPAKSLLGPLFSMLLLHGPPRWRAVTLFGRTVARLCASPREGGLEAGRVIMRRLLWNLNEESGNVAWGSPEALAESLCQEPRLAVDYHPILISYLDNTLDEGVYLDLPALRRGAVWGVCRLIQTRPDLTARAAPHLLAALQDDEDAQIPGLAAWGLGMLGAREAMPMLEGLRDDPREVELYRDEELATTTVGALAAEAAQRIAG